MHHILVDADSMIYAAACVSETRTYAVHNNGVFLGPYNTRKEAVSILETQPDAQVFSHLHVADFGAAAARLRNVLDRILLHSRQRFPAGVKLSVFVSGTGNYRERLDHKFPYKGNRVNTEKPQHLHRLREYVVTSLAGQYVHFMEPDDEIAIRLSEDPQAVACSIDKDLRQVPGYHMIPDKGFMSVSPRSGLLKLYSQIIGGDATDGVPGCYKISADGAAKLLLEHVDKADTLEQTARKFWGQAVACYKASIAKHGARNGHAKAEDAAIETARFVYLQRKRPSDPARPYLWEPPL